MIVLSALFVLFIDAFDITLVTCDVPWLDKSALEQIMSAEISELTEAERKGMILVVDQCTDKSVRLRTSNQSGQRERVVNIEGIAEEALLRTIALALSELSRESDSAKELHNTGHASVREVPKGVAAKSKTKVDIADEQRGQSGNMATTQDVYRIWVGAYLRWFPIAETFAPEIRFGVRRQPWRIELGGYGMGWSNEIGNTYLVAVTSTAGATLWHYQGTIRAGLDVLAELGVVSAYGEANFNSDETARFNIAAGGHLAIWIAPGRAEGFQPLLNIEVGWLRGLNLFVNDEFQGGFEGLSTRFGLVGTW